MKVLDCFYDSLSKWPDNIVYEDSLRNQTLTMRELDEMSARVYGFLLKQNIATEDVVAIRLPRCIHIPAVVLGVIKAGAAFVIIGELSGPENAKFFIEDSHAKMVITQDVMDGILKSEPVYGHKEAKPHDLACIVYSSGSSGYFKGSMHEYGQYDKCIEYFKEQNASQHTDGHQERIALIAGFHGVAGTNWFLHVYMYANYNDIVPFDVIFDAEKFRKEIADKRITSGSLAPIHVKMIDAPGVTLKNASVTFEASDGLYSDNISLFNRYGSTEYFGVMCSFHIDKPYDMTPCGQPLPYVEMYLADESGQKVKDGEIGEMYMKSQYFRGYINRPEETSMALVDGWLRTGDMAVLENGQYVIQGRKMDLLKTQEGYIIPLKISVEVKKASGLSWCYVKCFDHSPSPVICVYHKENVDIDLDTLREKLSTKLPKYMLPTHVVKLDTVKHFLSGKTDRFSFKSPLEK